MYEYISRNLQYPRQAIENNIAGRVLISFVIMPDGQVEMSQVEKGIGFGCDDEALRVVREMPTWMPAEQNGRKVPIRMFLPVLFKLP
jgi:protein TonB